MSEKIQIIIDTTTTCAPETPIAPKGESPRKEKHSDSEEDHRSPRKEKHSDSEKDHRSPGRRRNNRCSRIINDLSSDSENEQCCSLTSSCSSQSRHSSKSSCSSPRSPQRFPCTPPCTPERPKRVPEMSCHENINEIKMSLNSIKQALNEVARFKKRY